MQYISVIDYLLLPVYLYLFYLIVRRRSVKYTDTNLRKYFFTAFWLRMLGAVLYAMMVQYYYGYGDSFIFYYGGDFLHTQVVQDPGNFAYFFKPAKEVKAWFDFEVGDINYSGYLGVASNLMVMKISALASFLSFNKYLIITLFFGLFSFAGQWRMFLVFKDINKGKQLKYMAWAILYMPSLWFWGSGLIKDSVCIGGIGFIIHYLYKFFIRKEFSVIDFLSLIFFVYIVNAVKSYIIIVLAVSLATFIFYKFITPFKNIVIKGFIIVLFAFSLAVVAFVTNFSDQLQTLAEESKVQVDSYQKNYQSVQGEDDRSRGSVESVEIDASVTDLILHSPVAIFTCLFRPFIWEIKGKIFILFSSLEAMFMLFCTLFLLFKLKLFGFLRVIFNSPYILASFTIAILFALLIGFTTYNFGTMARYKIILLPFYFFTLVSMYTSYREKKDMKIASQPERE